MRTVSGINTPMVSVFRHIGDLGTFTEDSNGVLEGRFFNDAISLHGIYSVLGHIFTV